MDNWPTCCPSRTIPGSTCRCCRSLRERTRGSQAHSASSASRRRSSYSSDQGGECVEVAELSATVAVRDSKTPAGPTLTLAPAAFSAFVGWAAAAE
ncbi:DUF397 domain-containing protein [Streptomyces tendae]|uniref:DUF397 domain-containing protein n=1 Tax=Streptomyces tendae TaxID=1932 RepID=UPI003439B4E8